jgi:hypothetical protein
MEVSHLNRSHWIVVGGAAVTLISVLFFSWYSITIGPFSASVSAWDTGVIGKLAVIGALLLAAVAVAIVLNAQENIPVSLPMAALVLALFVALMVIFKFIDIHSHTAFGMWLTLIASLVAAYGAYELGGHNEIAARVNAAGSGSSSGGGDSSSGGDEL